MGLVQVTHFQQNIWKGRKNAYSLCLWLSKQKKNNNFEFNFSFLCEYLCD